MAMLHSRGRWLGEVAGRLICTLPWLPAALSATMLSWNLLQIGEAMMVAPVDAPVPEFLLLSELSWPEFLRTFRLDLLLLFCAVPFGLALIPGNHRRRTRVVGLISTFAIVAFALQHGSVRVVSMLSDWPTMLSAFRWAWIRPASAANYVPTVVVYRHCALLVVTWLLVAVVNRLSEPHRISPPWMLRTVHGIYPTLALFVFCAWFPGTAPVRYHRDVLSRLIDISWADLRRPQEAASDAAVEGYRRLARPWALVFRPSARRPSSDWSQRARNRASHSATKCLSVSKERWTCRCRRPCAWSLAARRCQISRCRK